MAYLVVLVAALARFVPHAPDFSPVYAALLFGGACLKKRDSIWFPVAVLAVSDVLLNFTYHAGFGWAQTLDWAGFAAVALIGWKLRKRISVGTVIGGSLAGATVFFIISNFAVWLGATLYPMTLAGLAACFVAALPFFGNTLASAVLFSGVLFGAYEFYRRKAQARKLAHATAHSR
jgi:Family of unknown function (DUF6580)